MVRVNRIVFIIVSNVSLSKQHRSGYTFANAKHFTTKANMTHSSALELTLMNHHALYPVCNIYNSTLLKV